jgi:hypothetical protein
MWTPLVDAPGNGQKKKKKFFSLPGTFSSEQFHFPHFLWLQIILQEFQTSHGQGSNRQGCKGASTSNHPTVETIPLHPSIEAARNMK